MSAPIILREPGTPRQRLNARIDISSLDDATRHDTELKVAQACFALLRQHYPGHFWFVDCSLRRGGVAISIPVLLGGNWVYFIRFADLTPAEVMRAGGEILERYRLPRSAFELGSFLEARGNHSILVRPGRKVPS